MQMERQRAAGPLTAQKMEFTIRVPVVQSSTSINRTKSRMRKCTKRTLSSNDVCHVLVVVKNHSWVELILQFDQNGRVGAFGNWLRTVIQHRLRTVQRQNWRTRQLVVMSAQRSAKC